ILGAILSLAGTAETVGRGIGLLVAYSAGLGVPFLVSAIALGAFLRFFKRYRPFIPIVERGAGLLLIAVGVLVFTNYYIVLNSWAISLTPEWLLKRLRTARSRSTFAFRPPRPTWAPASTRSAWPWRSTTRSRRRRAAR